MNQLARSETSCTFAIQGDRLAIGHGDTQRKRTVLPLLAVAHEAGPGAFRFTGKVLLIVLRRFRFEAKHLDNPSRRFAEVQSCLNHLRVVEHNHRTGRYLRGQVAKVMFLNLALPHQQFALVALLQWIFGNTLFGEVIIVIFDL